MSSLQDREEAHRREMEFRNRLRSEFGFYAENCLRIRTKTGDVVPFRLRRAQIALEASIADQLHRLG